MKKIAVNLMIVLVVAIGFCAFAFAAELKGDCILDQAQKEQLSKKYGGYFYNSPRKQELLKAFRAARPDFIEDDIATGFPIDFFKFNDGRTFLLVGGFTPHYGGQSEQYIAYDITAQKAYFYGVTLKKELKWVKDGRAKKKQVLVPVDTDTASPKFSGNPPEDVRELLTRLFYDEKICSNERR